MKLENDIKKILSENISGAIRMNAWISDEQRQIDVSVIDLEENTVTGTNHNYAPWVDGADFVDGEWVGGELEKRNAIPFEKLSLIQIEKRIGNNKLIFGFK